MPDAARRSAHGVRHPGRCLRQGGQQRNAGTVRCLPPADTVGWGGEWNRSMATARRESSGGAFLSEGFRNGCAEASGTPQNLTDAGVSFRSQVIVRTGWSSAMRLGVDPEVSQRASWERLPDVEIPARCPDSGSGLRRSSQHPMEDSRKEAGPFPSESQR